MKYVLVSVFDRAVQAYAPVMSVRAIGEATRMFRDEVNNPESRIHLHPGDYELYCLGEFSDDKGELFSSGPTLIVRGEDCVEVKSAAQS